LISSCDFAISIRVMQEFADAALRKKRLGVTVDEVRPATTRALQARW
jgi:hypothetical protein